MIALAAATVYAVLVPAHLVVLTGTTRVIMAALAAVTAALAAWIACSARRSGTWSADRLLVLACSLPVVNVWTHLWLTRQLEQTTLLMLVVVASAAILARWTHVVVAVTTAVVGWVVIVVVRSPQPEDQLVHYVVQLALSCALAAAVFAMQRSVVVRLEDARAEADRQRDELTTLSDRIAADLARSRTLVDASPVGISLADEHGHFVEVNATLCEMVGRAPDDLVGRSAEIFLHPEDSAVLENSGQLIEEDPHGVVRLETRFVGLDGSVLWVWLTLTHVAGPQGQVWTLAHVQDISERRRADDQHRRSAAIITAANSVAHTVQRGEDPRTEILDSLVRIGEATSAQFIEPLDDTTLVITHTCGGPDLLGLQIDLREVSVTAHAWRTGATVFADRVSAHPMVNLQLLEKADASSLMWAPVMVDGEVAAVVALTWTQQRGTVDELQRVAVETLLYEAGLAMLAERTRAQLVRTSLVDPLTGLLNRRGWEEEIARLDADRHRPGRKLTVALLDLDHFKRYNDTLGHLAGDAALAALGAALGRSGRPGDVYARWGGEEFAVAMPGCSASEAAAALERVRRCVPHGLTASLGYAVLDDDSPVAEGVRRADIHLYSAKAAGRDRAVGP